MMQTHPVVFVLVALAVLLLPPGARAAPDDSCLDVPLQALPTGVGTTVAPVTRDLSAVAAIYDDPQDAATALTDFGFCGNALATYFIPDMSAATVSVTAFSGEDCGTTRALHWMADAYADGLALHAIDLPMPLFGPPMSGRVVVVGAGQYTLFIQDDRFVWRITFPSVTDDQAIGFAPYYQNIAETLATAYQRSEGTAGEPSARGTPEPRCLLGELQNHAALKQLGVFLSRPVRFRLELSRPTAPSGSGQSASAGRHPNRQSR
jgi:hypothetical protein